MKKSKAPPKGQRSIASFIFKKADDPNINEGAGPSGAGPSAAKAPLPPSNKINAAERTPEEPPSKRFRTDAPPPTTAQPSAPKPRTTTPPNAEERHERWQSKLVGDDSAGMQRVRTQEALQQRGEPPPKMTPLELQVAELQRQVSYSHIYLFISSTTE